MHEKPVLGDPLPALLEPQYFDLPDLKKHFEKTRWEGGLDAWKFGLNFQAETPRGDDVPVDFGGDGDVELQEQNHNNQSVDGQAAREKNHAENQNAGDADPGAQNATGMVKMGTKTADIADQGKYGFVSVSARRSGQHSRFVVDILPSQSTALFQEQLAVAEKR